METTTTQKQTKEVKVKSIDGKKLILRGVIDSINKVPSKFGYSARIKMGDATYYFNCKIESTIDKMFKQGEKAAFTVKDSGKYLVIQDVFYTF